MKVDPPNDYHRFVTSDPQLRKVTFSVSTPGGDRDYHMGQQDVELVLMRLPSETWARLRGVHFKDRSRGARVLGYTSMRGRREITMCALPPRMSLTRFLTRGQTCEEFGARRGGQWSETAVRRFLIYDVFLHELGHLQVVDSRAQSARRKFADERRADDFATYWRHQIWSGGYPSWDPAHHPPSKEELAALPPVPRS
jgi:hypothetical protein